MLVDVAYTKVFLAYLTYLLDLFLFDFHKNVFTHGVLERDNRYSKCCMLFLLYVNLALGMQSLKG